MRSLRLTMVLGLAACGGTTDGDGADASPRDAPSASDGASASDAAPMSVDDFHACGATTDCKNPDSECLPVAALNGASVCLPTCEASSDCPVDTFCYACDSGPCALIRNHCFYSYCGQRFENGETGGGCRVGAEQGIPWAQQRPGWCYPFDDGAWGICLEQGEVPAGGACDDAASRCRGDGCMNCGAGLVCVNQVCEEICDPRVLLDRGEVPCPTGQDCLDRSEVHVFTTGTGHGSWGTCEPGDACLMLADDACPLSPAGQPQGCLPTNPVRPTGFCDPSADGDLATGATCPFDGPAGDPYECADGDVCVSDGTNAHCETLCDLAEILVTCAGANKCQALLWSTDPMIRTQDWGTCR